MQAKSARWLPTACATSRLRGASAYPRPAPGAASRRTLEKLGGGKEAGGMPALE